MASTILIVEDEQLLRESLAGLLEEEGYRVLQAANGAAAYARVVEEPVDLVLSDVRMPEMDGLSLLKRLHQLAPETPVIMMTAYGTVDSAVAAMRAGGWDYLLKPIQFDDLLVKVERALQFREVSRDRRIMSASSARSPPTISLPHRTTGFTAACSTAWCGRFRWASRSKAWPTRAP